MNGYNEQRQESQFIVKELHNQQGQESQFMWKKATIMTSGKGELWSRSELCEPQMDRKTKATIKTYNIHNLLGREPQPQTLIPTTIKTDKSYDQNLQVTIQTDRSHIQYLLDPQSNAFSSHNKRLTTTTIITDKSHNPNLQHSWSKRSESTVKM